MKANEGKLDRIIRAAVGIGMLAVSFVSAAPLKWVLLALGAIALITAATGFCGLYKLLGISTIKRPGR
jgi:hypothetical protein